MKLTQVQCEALYEALAKNSGRLMPQLRDVREFIEREFDQPNVSRPIIRKVVKPS
jgi:hypothetical protein